MFGTRKLGRTTAQRKAMLRQLTTDLLEKGRIETTVTRAKEVQPIAEKMITLGKGGTLADRRRALAFITKEDVVTSCSRRSLLPTLSATAVIPESPGSAFAAATLLKRLLLSWCNF